MEIRQKFLTKNDCFKRKQYIKPKGIMVHSTGANNPWLSRYIPNDGVVGVNKYNNHWDMSGVGACVHGFIGKAANGEVMIYQTLPWTMRGWHCSSGKKGSANNTHISFEICEDGLNDRIYFEKVYKKAVELCVYLCKEYNLTEKNIICHCEGYELGIASNHADVEHWFRKFGYNMDKFRADVKAGLKKETEVENMSKEELKEFIEEVVKGMGVGEPADAWAKGTVEKAKEMGFTDGSNPKKLANRQEVMVMIERAVEKK